jgi:hypothetical protein
MKGRWNTDTSAQESKGATGHPHWSAWKEYQDFQASLLRLGMSVFGGAKGLPYDPAASYIPETAAALHKWFILVLELGNRKSKGRMDTAATLLQFVLIRLDSIGRWLQFRGSEGLWRTIEGHVCELQKALGKGADKDFDARSAKLFLAVHSLSADLQGTAAMSAVREPANGPRRHVRGKGEKPPLTPDAAAVLDILKALPQHQAMTGPRILDALAKLNPPKFLDASTLTKHIMPLLKKHYGVKNKPRVGYYIEQP